MQPGTGQGNLQARGKACANFIEGRAPGRRIRRNGENEGFSFLQEVIAGNLEHCWSIRVDQTDEDADIHVFACRLMHLIQ